MRFRTRTTLGAIAALALLPGSAVAATITGGDGGERLLGTRFADIIDGNGGHDRLFGRAGDDVISGGEGRDLLYGERGNDTLKGDDGNDRLAGGWGDDVEYGGSGNDVLYANLGQDTLYGGDGNDRLWALARGDVHPGPGGAPDQVGDTVDGGAGNDVIRTRDGEVDRVTCGAGEDTAILDTVDVITDAPADAPNGSCEHVVRKAPARHGAQPQEATA